MLDQNLRYLRKKQHLSQQAIADALDIPRTTWSGYELGKVEPNISMLIRIADHFHVTVDDLVRTDISHQDLEIIRNKDLRVLAISVDDENRQNIELVDSKAEAGYLESFQDPEYIRELPKVHFPNLPDGTYRAFEIQGESMLPLAPGSIVICQYLENLEEIRDDKSYIIATRRDGLVYKRVRTHPGASWITAISDNKRYAPYQIPLEEISELWQYFAHLSFKEMHEAKQDWMEEAVTDIQENVRKIKNKIL